MDCGQGCEAGICCQAADCPPILCQAVDRCENRACQYTPVTCSASKCQIAGTCDPGTGTCPDPTNKPNLTACTGESICCNGVCCSGCCGSDGPCGACRVFVTGLSSNGELGGLAEADGICQWRATAAGLPGSYKAWLSDGSASPSTRFRCTAPSCSAQGYRLVDAARTLVATNWTDLTDNDLLHGINATELGVVGSFFAGGSTPGRARARMAWWRGIWPVPLDGPGWTSVWNVDRGLVGECRFDRPRLVKCPCTPEQRGATSVLLPAGVRAWDTTVAAVRRQLAGHLLGRASIAPLAIADRHSAPAAGSVGDECGPQEWQSCGRTSRTLMASNRAATIRSLFSDLRDLPYCWAERLFHRSIDAQRLDPRQQRDRQHPATASPTSAPVASRGAYAGSRLCWRPRETRRAWGDLPAPSLNGRSPGREPLRSLARTPPVNPLGSSLVGEGGGACTRDARRGVPVQPVVAPLIRCAFARDAAPSAANACCRPGSRQHRTGSPNGGFSSSVAAPPRSGSRHCRRG